MTSNRDNKPESSGEDRLHQALSLESSGHARRVYADWADAYDDDVARDLGYGAPELVAQALAAHMPARAAPVLDAGCGTGLAGEALAKRGPWPLYGLDMSPEMLARASAKGVYAGLIAADLGKPLPLRDRSFGGAVCSGTFAPGHVGPQAIGQIMGLLAAAAPFAFSVHKKAWDDDDFPGELDALQSRGVADLASVEECAHMENMPDHSCMLCVALKR